MSTVRVFFAMLSACLLSACAPFSSSHNSLLPDEQNAGSPFQSYSVPKTILKATIIKGDDGKKIQLQKDKVVDRDFQFRVDYHRSIIHDDDLQVVTDKSGYLKSVKAHTTDKTVEIVEKIAKVFMTNIGGKEHTGSLNRSFSAGAITQELALEFDPFNWREFSASNELLKEHKYCIAVYDRDNQPLHGSCQTGGSSKSSIQTIVYEDTEKPQQYSGFYFRNPRQHRVIVYQRMGGNWDAIWSGYEGFENAADLLEVRVDRGAFIELKADLTFNEGQLTKYHMVKNKSEVEGFLGIPMIIVTALTSAPGLAIENQNAELALDQKRLANKKKSIANKEKALNLNEEAAKLRSAGISPDGRRVYVPTNVSDPRAVQSTLSYPTTRSASLANRSSTNGPYSGSPARYDPVFEEFMVKCTKVEGLPEQKCHKIWSDPRNQ